MTAFNTDKSIAVLKLRILYLDDEDSYITQFENWAQEFNHSLEDVANESIIYECTRDNLDAMHKIASMKYNVFLCDQNLGGNRKGLGLWDTILREDKGPEIEESVLFALYTTPNAELSKECEQRKIMCLNKGMEFEELLYGITKKLRLKFGSYDEDLNALRNFYDKYKMELIEDLDVIKDDSFRLYIGKDYYSAEELKKELSHRTKLGVKLVQSYVDGLNFLKGNN